MFGEGGNRIGNPVYEARFVGCGFSMVEAARWLGVHPRTLYRQETGQARPAGPVIRALRLRAGILGDIHPDWREWRLAKDGLLYGHGMRVGYRGGEVLAISLMRQQIAALEQNIREQQQKRFFYTAANDEMGAG